MGQLARNVQDEVHALTRLREELKTPAQLARDQVVDDVQT